MMDSVLIALAQKSFVERQLSSVLCRQPRVNERRACLQALRAQVPCGCD